MPLASARPPLPIAAVGNTATGTAQTTLTLAPPSSVMMHHHHHHRRIAPTLPLTGKAALSPMLPPQPATAPPQQSRMGTGIDVLSVGSMHSNDASSQSSPKRPNHNSNSNNNSMNELLRESNPPAATPQQQQQQQRNHALQRRLISNRRKSMLPDAQQQQEQQQQQQVAPTAAIVTPKPILPTLQEAPTPEEQKSQSLLQQAFSSAQQQEAPPRAFRGGGAVSASAGAAVTAAGGTPSRRRSHHRRSNSGGSAPIDLDAMDDFFGGTNYMPHEDDPVTALFRSRTKQRVRFALEGRTPITTTSTAAVTPTRSTVTSKLGSGSNLSPKSSKSTLLGTPPASPHSKRNSSMTLSLSPRNMNSPTSSPNNATNSSSNNSGSKMARPQSPNPALTIKSFMKGSIFGNFGNGSNTASGNNNNNSSNKAEFEAEVAKEVERAKQLRLQEKAAGNNNNNSGNDDDDDDEDSTELIWESASMTLGPEVVRTRVAHPSTSLSNNNGSQRSDGAGGKGKGRAAGGGAATGATGELFISFVEHAETRAQVTKLLNKARRAQVLHYQYKYAVKCHLKALELLKQAKYPNDHPTVGKAMESLNQAYYAYTSYKNSANIVKMGIKYEDSGEWIRALKMYTIAYRIRRDNLSRSHPSLVVLLNMLGSIQIKRGELEEAMQIYELALKDTPRGSAGSTRYNDDARWTDDGNDSPTGSVQGGGGGGGNFFLKAFGSSSSSAQQQQQQRHLLAQPKMPPGNGHLLTRSVTFREMGTIHERWGNYDEALHMYHQSLDCIAQFKGISTNLLHRDDTEKQNGNEDKDYDKEEKKEEQLARNPSSSSLPSFGRSSFFDSRPRLFGGRNTSDSDILHDLESSRKSNSSRGLGRHTEVVSADGDDTDGMELLIGLEPPSKTKSGRRGNNNKNNHVKGGSMNGKSNSLRSASSSRYDIFFPPSLDEKMKKTKGANRGIRGTGTTQEKGSFEDLDSALTLHQIAQLHRARKEYNLALAAFTVSLRGMRYAVGKYHPNVAAILGNIGNLRKEMGDMDAAFETYQQVLAIESCRLGLSHPDVTITLHNIATIDAARGNYEHALSLYGQVLYLQKKLFGEWDVSVCVTSACMGDVYERMGDIERASECFDDALRVKTVCMGRHCLEVARLLHKLGKLAIARCDYHLADSYISKAIFVYRLNHLSDDEEWVIDACRDAADIDAALAMGRGAKFEC